MTGWARSVRIIGPGSGLPVAVVRRRLLGSRVSDCLGSVRAGLLGPRVNDRLSLVRRRLLGQRVEDGRANALKIIGCSVGRWAGLGAERIIGTVGEMRSVWVASGSEDDF